MRPFLLLILALLLNFTAAAQQQHLTKARQRSYLTKVFRLTDAQARHLYEHGLAATRPDFFIQVADSFPTDEASTVAFARSLPPGYYLVAHTEGPQLVYWLRSETDRQLTVIDNQVDLTLVVRDSLGRLLNDAQVALARRPVPYDAATRTYRLAHAGRAGLVAVTHAGRTTLHHLDKRFPYPRQQPAGWRWVGAAGRRVVFGFPLGYLTRPLRDLVRDLQYASYTSTGPVGLLRSIFREDVRDERQNHRADASQNRWASYVAMSKPKYRPMADTLRFKARVLSRPHGRPSRQSLTLWLGGGYGLPEKKIARLRPVRPGSYQYSLPLTDTLGLRADTRVGFRLADRRGRTRAGSQFLLEDYELKSTRYTLRAAEKEHRHGQPQALFLRGTDSNDLNLLDARVQLSITPATRPEAFSGRQVFVPDTLWTRRQPLDAVGETRLNVPANLFPAAEFRYTVQASFLNADNERRTESLTLPHHLDTGELTLELVDDSLKLVYKHLGKSEVHAAILRITRSSTLRDTTSVVQRVSLPHTLPLNAQATAYTLTDASGHTAHLALDAGNSALVLRFDRTRDSIFLTVENPRRLNFWYFVYRGNTLVRRGYGPAWALAAATAGTEPWSVSLHYLWGGQLRTAEYAVPLPRRQLVVRTEQPEVAYPGQKIQLKFTVTDAGGRPVPNADLTAYAHTSKFGQAQPDQPVPSFEPAGRGRVARRRFALRAGFENDRAATTQQLLQWPQWRHHLGLDSLRFYQFLYPESGAFYDYQPAPGGLTQLAPFVVDSGRVQPPMAVYVDDMPVYIHAVNQQEPYSFVASPGSHTVSIRTTNRLVTLRDVQLRHLHKLTLSIDVNQPCTELRVEKRPALLLPAETLLLSRSLLATDNSLPALPGSLRQGQVLRPLHSGSAAGRYRLNGPFRPDSVLLRRADGLRRSFLFEPLYRYDFAPGLLKLTSLDPASLPSLASAEPFSVLPFHHFALTEAALLARQQPINTYWAYPPRQPVFNNPQQTPAGQGRLELRLPAVAPGPQAAPLPAPVYLLLTRPDQPRFQRLQRGVAVVQALPPGRYRVALLLADSTCLAPAEEAVVRADGTTYFQLSHPDRQPAGPLGRRIRRLVQAVLAQELLTPAAELKQARRTIPVVQYDKPQPGWRAISGHITDRSTGEGLPGVTVLIPGTTIGTSTNADGSYTLTVPSESVTVQFSSIGYLSEERILDHAAINVALMMDTKQLSEVVVTGLGVEQRRGILGASVAFSTALQGRVAGVSISKGTAGAGAITIRGLATLPAAAQPLIILDGLPFNGRIEDLAPADIASVKLLKGEAAVGTYGSRAAHGVLFVTTKASGPTDAPTGRDPRLALRRNFADYAWWRPTLVTDARGEARTDVTLPDDVTGWDTFVLGSDGHGRTGSATGLLRSFKALLAELAVPRFLIEGDRAQVLGKTLNYRPDTAQVTTSFGVAGQPVRRQVRQVVTSTLDTLTITAPTGPDSVVVSFGLQQAGGYTDGEQRPIPVLPAGTRERIGTFALLSAPDTTLTLPFDPSLGPVTVRLESDALPVLLSEIQHLQAYAYLCNEQAASKLKALLLEAQIRRVQNQPFRGARSINFLIRKLQNGRHQPEGLWGTWPQSAVSPWATTHVVEALLAAEKAGYPVRLDRDQLQRYLLQELDYSMGKTLAGQGLGQGFYQSDDDQLRLLHLLHQLGVPADYRTYLDRLDRRPGRPALDHYLARTELRQQLGLPYQLDTLRRYRLRTQAGGIFYADTLHAGSYFRYLLRPAVGTTLLAYRLLRAQGGHEAELIRIRTYLLQLRRADYWQSTYEAARILETIGPDLLATGPAALRARVQLGGSQAPEISTFPQLLTLPAGAGPLTVRKQGLLPVYATAYQTRWNPLPAATAAPFTVTTALAGQTGTQIQLQAGKPTELVVTVDVRAEARYVLLEVPIPAGCSYGEPQPGNSFEVHREYLRHQTGIFIDRLPVGVHTFRVALQPRYRGRYTLNPAKAELVYFPTRFGRSASKQVRVE